MVNRWPGFVVLLGVAVCLGFLNPAIAEAQEAVVTRVVDGDTIVVTINGHNEKIRLIGVDTPETVHPNKPVQYFGKEASSFTKRMATGKTVRLELDQASAVTGHRDKYGRLLAYVYLPDGTLLNAEIIRQGYGHAYTRFPFNKMDEFRALERKAQEAGRGLWAADSPAAIAPEPPTGGGPAGNCQIKGNINSKGSKIYHVPGGCFYDRTRINESKGERWFCTEEEAIKAGWRSAR